MEEVRYQLHIYDDFNVDCYNNKESKYGNKKIEQV